MQRSSVNTVCTLVTTASSTCEKPVVGGFCTFSCQILNNISQELTLQHLQPTEPNYKEQKQNSEIHLGIYRHCTPLPSGTFKTKSLAKGF